MEDENEYGLTSFCNVYLQHLYMDMHKPLHVPLSMQDHMVLHHGCHEGMDLLLPEQEVPLQ